MQRKKIYSVSFYFDLHTVSCPGVWLCPKGKVAVRVGIFGVSEVTKLLPPAFPLPFQERFHFQKRYKKASLHQAETAMHRAPVRLELLQYPPGACSAVRLAEFKATLADITYPPSGDLDLLFSPTNTFPGIIAPKAEVSTRLTLTECGLKDNSGVPLTIFSKGTKARESEEPVIRQKPVCHTKHYLYCSCFDKNVGPQVLGKTFMRKKDHMARNRTSQEPARKVSPAHQLSHRNNGDIIPGNEELTTDGEWERCTCSKETGLETVFDQYPSGISDGSSLNEPFVKEKWRPQIQVSQEKYFDIPGTPVVKTPPLKQRDINAVGGPCCLCCPRVPDPCLLLEGKSSSTFNIPRDKNPEKLKKDAPKCCICCDSCTRLMELLRKTSGEDKGQSEKRPLFYSNLCKAYQKLIREYCSCQGLKTQKDIAH